VAEEEGILKAEIDDVKAIVMAVTAGQIRAQFADARRRQVRQRKTKENT
jgi:hypothetical protein